MKRRKPVLPKTVSVEQYQQLVREQWSEREFQDAVIALARANGWLVHHQRPARTKKGWRTTIQGTPGFPDLVITKGGLIYFWELKSETGHIEPAQEQWYWALRWAGLAAELLKPHDWGYIKLTLEREAAHRETPEVRDA